MEADLSYPLLVLFLLFWALLALAGIFSTVLVKSKARDSLSRLIGRFRESFHKRHSHQE